MAVWDDQYKAAETLRKDGKFVEAETILRELWLERPSAVVGAGLIYCLRKLDRYHEAIEIGSEVAARFPDHEWACREYAWSLYSGEIKPSKELGDLGRAVHFAQKLLEVTHDPIAMKMAAFAVIDVAKERGRWDIVSSWCDRIDKGQLSVEPQMIGKRKGISELEKWYFAKIKALIELAQWSEARLLAQEASTAFPRKADFVRWAAQARAKQGDVAGGIEELETLVRKGAAPWYVLHELAEMQYRIGANDLALRNACKAALAPEENKLKVNLFELLAQIQLQHGRIEAASRGVQLAKQIRQVEGWGIKNSLMQLETQINSKIVSAGLAYMPLDLPQLSKSCRRDWEEGAMAGQARFVGRVSRLIDGKDFAFITPEADGENVYVKLRDLPRAAQRVNARVEYSLIDAYDAKKDRNSVRASDVCLLE